MSNGPLAGSGESICPAAQPNSIVVNDHLLRRLGARVGDSIEVATGYDPQTRTYSGQRRLGITGRVSFIYGAADQSSAAVRRETLDDMESGARRDRASLFMIRVRKGADPDRVRDWIEGYIPTVSAISIATAIAQVDERLSYFRQLAFILGAVSLGVGFLLVTTLVTVSVNERLGEIVVMRAIGVAKSHIVFQIVVEGIVIMVLGTLAGLGLGLVTARYLNSILASFPGLPAAIDFFLFEPRSAWTALGLLTGAGILAGVYPSWRGASMPIAMTLREEAVG